MYNTPCRNNTSGWDNHYLPETRSVLWQGAPCLTVRERRAIVYVRWPRWSPDGSSPPPENTSHQTPFWSPRQPNLKKRFELVGMAGNVVSSPVLRVGLKAPLDPDELRLNWLTECKRSVKWSHAMGIPHATLRSGVEQVTSSFLLSHRFTAVRAT